MFTMDDLLEIAIKMKKNGEAVYNNAIEKIEIKELKTLLTWMAKEESSHARWFSDLRNQLSVGVTETNLKKMVPRALEEMMGEKTLSLGEVDFSRIKSVSYLLEIFIGFENDTIAFYELLEMFIENEGVIDGLEKIILEEKNHIKTLQDMMRSTADDTAL